MHLQLFYNSRNLESPSAYHSRVFDFLFLSQENSLRVYMMLVTLDTESLSKLCRQCMSPILSCASKSLGYTVCMYQASCFRGGSGMLFPVRRSRHPSTLGDSAPKFLVLAATIARLCLSSFPGLPQVHMGRRCHRLAGIHVS